MSRRTWMLWLMLALLPMRLWAASVMPAMAPGSGAAPCHEQAAAHIEHAPAAEPSCCTTCDLCHGTPADIALPRLPSPELPEAEPAPSTPRDTGRTLAGRLDRPPRHFLA